MPDRSLILCLVGIFAFSWLPSERANAQPEARLQLPSETLLPSYLRQRMIRRISSRRDNAAMNILMQPLAMKAGGSTVEVLSEDERVALGTIVTQDGFIITKGSELIPNGSLRVRLPDDRMVEASLVDQQRSMDVSLLKVKSTRLVPIQWDESIPSVGSFLYSVGRQGDPVGIGVVSVAARPIKDRGLLGVGLRSDEKGARVVHLVPGSGADDAGISVGDLITSVQGTPMSTQTEVTNALRAMYPGDIVTLSILRDGRDQEFLAKAEIRELSSLMESSDDVRVNGPRNSRQTGFDLAIQHDTVLGPDQCGGPVIDTSGRVVAMNIARAGRVCSYAIPSAAIKPIVERMILSARN